MRAAPIFCFLFLFVIDVFMPSPIFGAGREAILKAREFKAREEFKEALVYYIQAVESMPDDSGLLKEAAQVAGWAGEYDRALEWYGVVLKMNSKDLDAELGKAFVLGWKRDYSGAMAGFKKILKASPGYLDAWIGLARTQSWQGNYNASESSYLEALKRDADCLEALRGVMDLYRWQGKNEEGIGIAGRILDLEPDDLSALISLGMFLRDLGRHKPAIAAFQKALEIDPERPDVHAELGQLYARALKLDDAVTELQKTIALNQDNVDAYVTLGRVYGYKRKIEESVLIYKNALDRDPGNLDALNGLARTYGYGRLWKKSESTFRRVLEIDPANQEAHEGLKRLESFNAPAVFIRHFFTTVRNKDVPESIDNVQLVQGEFNYPIDPDRSVDFRMEFDDQIQKYEQTGQTSYHIRRFVYGLGTRWRLPLGFSFIGRGSLANFRNSGDNLFSLEKQSHGEGFGLIRWERGNNTVSFTVSKENYISAAGAGLGVSNIMSLSVTNDMDITDRLSVLYEMNYSRYSRGWTRREHTWRSRYRIPLGEILLAEYRFRYRDHPDERNHKIFLGYNGQLSPKFSYHLEYAPDYNSPGDKIGHEWKLFLSFGVTDNITVDGKAGYSYNADWFFDRVFNTFVGVKNRF